MYCDALESSKRLLLIGYGLQYPSNPIKSRRHCRRPEGRLKPKHPRRLCCTIFTAWKEILYQRMILSETLKQKFAARVSDDSATCLEPVELVGARPRHVASLSSPRSLRGFRASFLPFSPSPPVSSLPPRVN